MSLQFSWQVVYDDDSSGLGATKGPKNRGVHTTYHGTSSANARLTNASSFQASVKGVHISEQVRMSVDFSDWEVVDDGACIPGVMLGSSQVPQNKGVYTMFHGTSVASARLIIANGFKPSAGGMLGKGVYVSRDMNKAARYPLNSNPSDRVILEVRVRVGLVKRIDKDNHPMQFTWSSHGYNTAWVPPNCGMLSVPSGMEEDCVFDPKRVKVVGIVKAPNAIIEKELKDLLAKVSKNHTREDLAGLNLRVPCVRGRSSKTVLMTSCSAGNVSKISLRSYSSFSDLMKIVGVE